uniref:C-type lectin domain-containing protein n=1 Tax=Loxodonta africana TaxID=9785 RepID=G3SWJ3_LOXAF
ARTARPSSLRVSGPGPCPLVLLLFFLPFITVLWWLSWSKRVSSTVPSNPLVQLQGLEHSKQEEIYQKLTQLKAGVDCLCHPCFWEWTFFQGNCYFFSNSQWNWYDAITACQEVGAQLVVIKTAEKQNFLQVQTSTSNLFTWIGLSDLKHEGIWHWVDGSSLLLSFMKYWNKGEPNSSGEEKAEFRGEGWKDSKCDNSKFWICKTTAASCSSN